MTYKKNGSSADVTQESTGIAIAYTMGGATIAIQNNSQDNHQVLQVLTMKLQKLVCH